MEEQKKEDSNELLENKGLTHNLPIYKNRELKKNILLLILVIVMFFLLLEIVLRLLSYPGYGFEEGFFEKDDVIGYKLSSNFSGTHSIYGKVSDVRTNSKGLRDDREYDYEKKNFRIVILGDSMTFGNGVNIEESYPEYLRELFSNQNVEVINLGVPGYGINNEYLSFIEEGSKYNPNIILIGYVTNDWNTHQMIKKDNEKYIIDKNYSLPINDKGLLASSSNKFSVRSVHLFLLFNIKSYSFVYTKMRLLLSGIINKYWDTEVIPAYFWDSNSLEYKQAYDGYYSILKMLKKRTNATIVIFIGPFRENVLNSEDIQKQFSIAYDVNVLQTQNSIKEIANRLNISVIEVTYNNTDIFIKTDGHWNAKGNKMMADTLYSELKKLSE